MANKSVQRPPKQTPRPALESVPGPPLDVDKAMEYGVAPDAHPFTHLAGKYKGEAWDELLEAIKQNRVEQAQNTIVE